VLNAAFQRGTIVIVAVKEKPMPLIISDEELAAIGLTGEQARIEMACALFQAGKLTLGQARRMSGLPRLDFEDELIRRRIPVYTVTEESWAEDLKTLPLRERVS
jgi:predicted HTH domain antitoxin